MALAILAASVNHPAWPPVLILIVAPFPPRLSRYTRSDGYWRLTSFNSKNSPIS
jgi:hypothetical protein